MKIGSYTAWFALIVCCRWCWLPLVSSCSHSCSHFQYYTVSPRGTAALALTFVPTRADSPTPWLTLWPTFALT